MIYVNFHVYHEAKCWKITMKTFYAANLQVTCDFHLNKSFFVTILQFMKLIKFEI